MSGPKLSEAEIERLRQEQLERERQAALKRLMDARSKYQISCDKARKLIAYARNTLDQIDDVYRNNAGIKLDAVIKSIVISSVSSNAPEDYITASNAIESALPGYADDINKILEDGLNRSKNDKAIQNNNRALKAFSDVMEDDAAEKQSLRIDFQNKYPDKPGKSQKEINEEQERLRIKKQLQDKYDEYAALSLTLGTKLEKPESFSSFEELETAVNDLLQEYKRKDEMDYIANQINDVMVKMGYSFVTSTVMTKKDMGETELSIYRDSGRAGVAVYTDESGAVMMRMTVLDDSCDITEEDREFSYQSQIDFCSRHQDLVEALDQRGVYLKQKSYRAPSKDHTFKMNVDGQGASVTANKNKKQDQKIDRRARRRARNKKMRIL